MRLIRDHCKAFALCRRQFLHFLQRKGKGLDGADHDLLAARECLRQFAALALAFALDAGHHPRRALEIENCLLQLRIQYIAIRHHQHRIE